MADKENLMRTAQAITCEYRQCDRDGIVGDWTAWTNARAAQVTLGAGRRYNQAVIEIADTRWHESRGVRIGYNVRLRYESSVIFQGFVVLFRSGFSTSVVTNPQHPPQAREYVYAICLDYRWLYDACSPVYGQVARGASDYYGVNTLDSATFMSGRRCIFNADGQPNMDATAVNFTSGVWPYYATNFNSYVFGNSRYGGSYWTAGKAINLLLSPLYNRVSNIVAISNPMEQLPGLTHADFDTIVHNVCADGLNAIDAVHLICQTIGWTFREDYTTSGPVWIFYKPGMASGGYRGYTTPYTPVIYQEIHAPAVGESIGAPDGAVRAGAKIACSMELNEDITTVINQPWGLMAPHQFEITAELVPAWPDTDLHVPVSGVTNLYLTEADLAKQADPDAIDYFKYHHTKGSDYDRDAGRKWALNESGQYTGGEYDRGKRFDFSTVGIPADYITADGKSLYGPFNRRFGPCLTYDKDTLNSVGYRLQWSCDGGTTWQELDCPFEVLSGECGVRISISNMAEIVDKSLGTIAAGDYAGQETNFFTSLADDVHNGRVFKTGQWLTRVRVTATIQMDQRPRYVNATIYNGSPFIQAKIYDFSDRYLLAQRCSSSSYYGGILPAWDVDDTAKLEAQMERLRLTNEDMAIHGMIMLDRLWIGDGGGEPEIALGDSIYNLSGREYSLSQSLGDRVVHPEIIEIQYMIQEQKEILFLRDPRLCTSVTWDSSSQKYRAD